MSFTNNTNKPFVAGFAVATAAIIASGVCLAAPASAAGSASSSPDWYRVDLPEGYTYGVGGNIESDELGTVQVAFSEKAELPDVLAGEFASLLGEAGTAGMYKLELGGHEWVALDAHWGGNGESHHRTIFLGELGRDGVVRIEAAGTAHTDVNLRAICSTFELVGAE